VNVVFTDKNYSKRRDTLLFGGPLSGSNPTTGTSGVNLHHGHAAAKPAINFCETLRASSRVVYISSRYARVRQSVTACIESTAMAAAGGLAAAALARMRACACDLVILSA
jgi:hypothetical protein